MNLSFITGQSSYIIYSIYCQEILKKCDMIIKNLGHIVLTALPSQFHNMILKQVLNCFLCGIKKSQMLVNPAETLGEIFCMVLYGTFSDGGTSRDMKRLRRYLLQSSSFSAAAEGAPCNHRQALPLSKLSPAFI